MDLAGAGGPAREGVRMGVGGAGCRLLSLWRILGTAKVDLARAALNATRDAHAIVFSGEAILLLVMAALASRKARTPPRRRIVRTWQRSRSTEMSMGDATELLDVVVGGGRRGMIAAQDLARAGRSVLLPSVRPHQALRRRDPAGAIAEFAHPRCCCRRLRRPHDSPSDRAVEMPIDGGFVGMVDREYSDEWLPMPRRSRRRGATHRNVPHLDRDADGAAIVALRRAREPGTRASMLRQLRSSAPTAPIPRWRRRHPRRATARHVRLSRDRAIAGSRGFRRRAVIVIYRGSTSPDFYGRASRTPPPAF